MPIFDRGGALTMGYGYPNLCAAEGCNAPGSPCWALKAFLALALPEEHPFWQAEEKPYTPPRCFLDEQVRLLLTRDAQNRQVAAYTAGNHAWKHMHEPAKKRRSLRFPRPARMGSLRTGRLTKQGQCITDSPRPNCPLCIVFDVDGVSRGRV